MDLILSPTKYGKVFGAKVMTDARNSSARCYGYTTINLSEDASKCIHHLNSFWDAKLLGV